VFDSGVGGLPYLEALRLRIPGAPCHFAADREGFPYGRKTREEVRALVIDRVGRIADRFSPRLIVLEATGGLETPVAAALVEAHLPTAVINPRQARDFARALGCLAKTDAFHSCAT